MKDESDRVSNRLPVDEGRDHLMVQIVRMVYQQDKTLTEVAAETGLNRWQVSRLLQEAKDLGVVRIEIVPRTMRRPDLEADLTRTFGLRDAIVVPGPIEYARDMEGVQQAAGQYLAAIKPRPLTIGVSWGRTMGGVAHWLPSNWNDGVTVVQINGTVAPVPGIAHHNDVAEIFARKGKGRMVPLPVPAIVGARMTREVLEKDRVVADVLDLARSAQVLVFSIGAIGEESVLIRSGNILKSEMDSLVRAGAIGDVLGHFINRRGQIVDAELDARVIGLSLADLRHCDRAIGISAGPDKHEVTLGALQAGLINVLVSDEATATFALEHSHDR